MFKTQVEWFHCQVLNILWRYFIIFSMRVYTMKNCHQSVFIQSINQTLFKEGDT